MSDQKIKIKVDTTYLQEASDPSNNKYYFLYTVSIDNIGLVAAKPPTAVVLFIILGDS